MTALQLSIGALNDVVDAERDRGIKLGKPIPAGLVDPRAATLLVGLCLGLGLGLSAWVRPLALGVAAVGAAIGYAYDLWLKPTRWAWLPFAFGIPLLPVFAWVGATGSVPAAFALLVPLAATAGAGLALANEVVDVERDRAAGVATPASLLGRRWAWRAATSLLLGASGIGAAALIAVGAEPLALITAATGIALLGAGLLLGRAESAGVRERGWELSAVGIGVVAVALVFGLVGRGLI